MDFTKLNNEFLKLQEKVANADKTRKDVLKFIQELEKEISIITSRIKKEKIPMVKYAFELVIKTKNSEVAYLKNLLIEETTKVLESK